MAEHDRDEGEAPKAPARVIGDVLIVDDSAGHLRLMASILKRWGYRVHEAGSGDQALEVLGRETIDLVLSDWVMPGMSGLELCERARALCVDRYVYFILLTSKTERADVAAGLEAGADDFLSKPVSAEELHARIFAGERLIASQRALEDRNGQLAEMLDTLQSLYDAIARDLVEARRLQQSLVPAGLKRYDGAEVALHLRPSGHVGGDLVGSFAIREGQLAVYSIDVSGHGIASALMTARLASYFSGGSRNRNIALERTDTDSIRMRPPEQVAAELNQLINDDLETELYFTMAFAVCDLKTGGLKLVQAGHPHPMILRGDGRIERVGRGGLPVGLIDGASYEVVEERLMPGDRLVLYSDGFVEQEDPGGAMLEEEGMAGLIRDSGAMGPEPALDRLIEGLARHAGRAEFDDDVSCAILDYRGRDPGAPEAS
ncbi:PP2C family protein-serine/threonine phosphatase [Ovoidimarina sediminis]|uniref:PP2C family protein-serine/threonine phosphatase n=1 Tax=Ovoidimarina sediminis TaxID=3079856 RepID=UPI0029148E68|nr:fused response regulator/phosphatase [Rhodophyticola sp. MJ-SS7]MDU8944536.1 fused response regulator/phosphatase [Rhodophyticola sp. MJ-SS7]